MQIIEAKSKKQRYQFVRFQRKLYKGNPYYVPQLDRMEYNLFSPKNAMAENCDYQLWLALDANKVIGRIAAIINHDFNHDHNIRQARFSHFDVIEDEKAAHALLNTAEQWAIKQGMNEFIGPFGFNNLDKHGLLVEGFEELACQSSNYNFPYYQTYIESYGFRKKHDWVERLIKMPKEEPEKVRRIAAIVKERFNLETLNLKDKDTLNEYTSKLLELYNETYSKLYGVSPLNERQKEALKKSFIPLLDLDLVAVIINQEKDIVGFGINMHSLSKSLQKADGRLFPFGFLHLIRNKKNNPILDLLLIGIHPDYQRKGINAMIFHEITNSMIKHKIEWIETTQNLESNTAVQNLWSGYDARLHKRARLYQKTIKA